MNDLIKQSKESIKLPPISSEEIDEEVKPVLRKMEKNGIKLDSRSLKELEEKLSKRLLELEKEIYNEAGGEFNIGSPIQMAEILFDRLKLPTEGLKKTKSGISTAASELRKIEDKHVIIALILESRELSKLISTYLKPLPLLVDENDRLHTSYSLDTSTGRLTSSDPNLQNIPIKGNFGTQIRRAFVAEKGKKLICADYSQIELRIIAAISQDQAMIDSFKKGEDIHTKTAADIFHIPKDSVTPDHRRIAKAVNFGIAYGQTPFGLSQALRISTEEAATYIRNYFDIHKGIKDYINAMIIFAHEKSYVETLFGTRRYLPDINSSIRFVAEAAERAAINMPIQGTAAEILKLAMIELDKRLSKSFPDAKMLLTVHDELVIEAPGKESAKVSKITKETMEGVVDIGIPIEVNVGIGDNWAEAK